MKKLNNNGFGVIVIVLIFVVVSVLGGLGWYIWSQNKPEERKSEASTATQQSQSKEPTKKITEPAKGTVITTGDSEFGTMLFNDKKQAIYIWELEESSKAECYGDCAEAWPPVLTDGTPRAAGAVNGALLGTTQRTDGSTQVTYNGHPLYYYAHEGPGEVECHNISTHGGLWWVIQPSGNRAD